MPRDDLVEAAGAVVGVQAQILGAARLSLRARVADLRPEDVDRALWEDRTLVKAWLMRGTLHLVPAEDYAVFATALRRPRDAEAWPLKLADLPRLAASLGMAPEDVAAVVNALGDALAQAPLTRQELAERVVDAIGAKARPWVEHSWGGVIRVACLLGKVCFGPPRGREVTFVSVREWLPGAREVPIPEAEAMLLRRYLRAYGPATPQDFASWSGVRVGDARAMWQRIAEELVAVSCRGDTAWILREDEEVLVAAEGPENLVHLLPSFDAYLLGHRDKGHIVNAAHYKRVYRKAGWLSPVALVDGRAAGVWHHKVAGKRLTVRIEPFRPLSARIRTAFRAEDIGRFLGVDKVALTVR